MADLVERLLPITLLALLVLAMSKRAGNIYSLSFVSFVFP
jgi:hypothetical protein